jgi:hypothetical protein
VNEVEGHGPDPGAWARPEFYREPGNAFLIGFINSIRNVDDLMVILHATLRWLFPGVVIHAEIVPNNAADGSGTGRRFSRFSYFGCGR